MKKIYTFAKEWLTIPVAVVSGVFFVAAFAQAATTIGVDLTTAGNVYATSTIQATGAITGYGALNITGVSTYTGLGIFNGGASSTLFSSYGPSYFGATATSSFSSAGALTLVTPLAVTSGGTGVTTSTGTGNTVLSASPTFTGTAILAGATLSGLASTTQLKVGNDQVSTVSGMIFGTCTLVTVTVTATSTAYTTCTGATGVTSSYTVFMQPGVPLPSGLILDAASSTATTGTLSLRVTNATAGANTATGAAVVNFWAVR